MRNVRALAPRIVTESTCVRGVLASAAFAYAKVLPVLVNFATGAYYLGFLFPIVAWSWRRDDGVT